MLYSLGGVRRDRRGRHGLGRLPERLGRGRGGRPREPGVLTLLFPI